MVIKTIMHTHLDYLEDLQPAQLDNPEVLNSMYVECHRRIQVLKALGENIDVHGRVLAPNVLRAFLADIFRRWLIHAKREGISEGSITKQIVNLNEEVDGARNVQKIRGESSAAPTYVPTATAFQVSTKLRKSKRQTKQRPEAFCVFCEARGHWARDCQKITDTRERIEKLKATNRCFICLNRGHAARQGAKEGKDMCTVC
jgi:hypothetical protein